MKRFIDSIRLAIPCVIVACAGMYQTAQATSLSTEKKFVGSVRVSYADLDLTRQSDVDILLERIKKAAYRACGGNPRLHPTYSVMPGRTVTVFKECREDAIARAVDEVDVPVLAQARLNESRK
jgi:UrcA family protein